MKSLRQDNITKIKKHLHQENAGRCGEIVRLPHLGHSQKTHPWGDRMLAQCIKPAPAMPTSHIREQVQVEAALLPPAPW